ncbi:MAG: DUF1292 domain-containing protein [bacterium LCO1.1]|uniref:DUF1292 domain-containing protein n=1 Tax=Candidatus Weimeria bifida TaxID=2599074 RepID=A0A6N7J098_9FIRM|nr:DUF1292 domain-containing protein [Candidatus Weimeria bifida]
MEKISFFDEESGKEQDFYIISETVINQHSYLLVSDQDPDKEEETDCYIMRKTADSDGELEYELIENQKTIDAVFAVFREELSDTEE